MLTRRRLTSSSRSRTRTARILLAGGANFGIWAWGPPAGALLIVALGFALGLPCVLGSRILLNLREYADVSTEQDALGAGIRLGEGRGAGEDVEMQEVSDIRFS